METELLHAGRGWPSVSSFVLSHCCNVHSGRQTSGHMASLDHTVHRPASL